MNPELRAALYRVLRDDWTGHTIDSEIDAIAPIIDAAIAGATLDDEGWRAHNLVVGHDAARAALLAEAELLVARGVAQTFRVAHEQSKARAEAAEARIAAALAERCEGPMCECCDMVLGALTGGTE